MLERHSLNFKKENLILMKEMVKKYSTDQRFILKRNNSLKNPYFNLKRKILRCTTFTTYLNCFDIIWISRDRIFRFLLPVKSLGGKEAVIITV